jgi:hypothetical protein
VRCDYPVEYEDPECPRCLAERRARLSARLRKVGIALAALLSLLGWQRRALTEAWTSFIAEIEQTRNPGPRAEASGASVAPPHVDISSFVYLASTPASAPADPALTAPPPIADAVAPPSPKIPADEHSRRFYGVVYDVATLKPVAGAKLVFKMSGAENGWPVTTNALGHYQRDLVKATVEIPMVVEVTPVPGYRKGQLEDTDPPLRQRSHSARRGVLEETTDYDLEPVPLRYQKDAVIVSLDLVLLPVRQQAPQ